MTVKLGLSSVYGLSHSDLVKTVIALAQEAARTRVESSNFTDFTDNTTGTAATAVGAVTVPPAFTATGTDVAPKAGFDAALDKIEDVQASLAESLNPILGTLGAAALTYTTGTATAGTIPAMDKTLTAVSGAGSNAVNAIDGRARITAAVNNQSTIIKAVNQVAVAVGYPILPDLSGGSAVSTGVLASLAATGTGALATAADQSLSDTATDAALTALANNYATAIAHVASILGAPVADLTNSVGGTASDTVSALAAWTAATASGSNLAPKAGFDTEVQVIENNLSDVTSRVNLIRGRFGYSQLTNSTAVTPDTTLAAQASGLTAVDGTGSNGLEVVSANTTLTALRNNIATLVAAINTVAAEYGVTAMTDSSGGTASATTVVNVPASGAGTAATGATGVLDTDVDAALVIIKNAVTTFGNKLNAMTSATIQSRPMGVVVSY